MEPMNLRVGLITCFANLLPGRMVLQDRQCRSQQRETRFGTVPGRRAGRMGQRDNFCAVAVKGDGVKFTDHIVEFFHLQQLADRQFANRQDQIGFKQIDFRLQPVPAAFDFGRTRHTIAALGIFTRKTAAHCGHVNTLPKSLFLKPDALEPFEHCFTGRPGKGFAEAAFLIAGRLTDQQNRR